MVILLFSDVPFDANTSGKLLCVEWHIQVELCMKRRLIEKGCDPCRSETCFLWLKRDLIPVGVKHVFLFLLNFKHLNENWVFLWLVMFKVPLCLFLETSFLRLVEWRISLKKWVLEIWGLCSGSYWNESQIFAIVWLQFFCCINFQVTASAY